jgi:hypothetical protein
MPRRNISQDFALALKLHRDRLLRDLEALFPDPAARQRVGRDVDADAARLLDALVKADERLRAHEDDADLSESGRRRAMAETAVPLLSEIAQFEKQTAGVYAASFQTMSGLILKGAAHERPTDPAERVAYELRQREIRDSVRALDPLERTNAYLGETDPEVLDAFESAPPSPVRVDRGGVAVLRPFIDPDLKNMAVAARARKLDPDLAAKMDVADRLRGYFSSLVDEARRSVQEAAPGVVRDDLAETVRAGAARS